VNAVTVTFEGGGGVRVLVDGADVAISTGQHVGQAGQEEPAEEPVSPIAIETKELLWGGGAFLVFLVLMRLFLVPRVKQGMDARYQRIRSELEEADDTRARAQREVAEYQAELATVRGVATERIDAARRQLEAERSERIAEVNARIAARRAEAAAAAEQTKAAARETIDEAVASVASRAVELSIGKRPDPDVVSRVVADVTGVGVES
jgi:F-type H+-transporting ATPase subunit b